MKKILLTSAGFQCKSVELAFVKMLKDDISSLKALFIPTAAIDNGAKAMLPKCKADLLNAGLADKNIFTYDLDYVMSYEELKKYDIIYFCGGNPTYLLKRIYDISFENILLKFVNEGGIYVGVSAGSIIATNNSSACLGYVNCTLSVHQSKGSCLGKIDMKDVPHIMLTDNQGLLVLNESYHIIGEGDVKF